MQLAVANHALLVGDTPLCIYFIYENYILDEKITLLHRLHLVLPGREKKKTTYGVDFNKSGLAG